MTGGLEAIVDGDTARVLRYVDGVCRQGHRPTVAEVEQYAAAPGRRREPLASTTLLALQGVRAALAGWSSGGQFVETIVEYGARLGWLASDGTRVTITPLGSAVVRAVTTTPDAEVDELVLDKDDPLALARVVGRIAELGSGLVVDPYVRADQALVLLATRVTRLLIRDANTTDVAGVKATLGAAPVDRTIELRAAPAGALHDRLVIPDEGDVWMLGASLNGLGRHVTTLVRLHDGAGALRHAYEETWRNADPIITVTPPATP